VVAGVVRRGCEACAAGEVVGRDKPAARSSQPDPAPGEGADEGAPERRVIARPCLLTRESTTRRERSEHAVGGACERGTKAGS
jgi:hypothetical protein